MYLDTQTRYFYVKEFTISQSLILSEVKKKNSHLYSKCQATFKRKTMK